MGAIGDAKIAALEAAGEDEIFGLIADGMNASDIIKHYNVGWNLFHKWVASAEGRAQRYDEAKKMAGHYGVDRVTVQNLEVVQVRPEDNILLIRGSMPGAEGDYVIIRESKKRPKGWKPAVASISKKKAAAAAKK